jgi:hypothetical protein
MPIIRFLSLSSFLPSSLCASLFVTILRLSDSIDVELECNFPNVGQKT